MPYLKHYINRFHLPPLEQCYYLDERYNSLVNLSPEQYQKVQRLCGVIAEDTHTKFVYRGDNRVNDIYNASTNSGEFARRFFMVGEKGNEFLGDEFDKHNTIDVESLFLKLHNFTTKSSKRKAICKRIPLFYKHHKQFFTFFRKLANIEIFNKAFSRSSKWSVKDYYEMFLHTIEMNGEDNNSSKMLSTTLNYKTAYYFKQEDGVLIVGWVTESGLIKFGNMNKKEETIQRLGLPTYKRGVFPEQQEICLKYGLPPHNILGYFFGDDCRYFVINHHLLCNQKNDTHFDKIHKRGIYINQTNFLEYLGLTKYKRGYRLVANEYTYLH